MRAWLAIGLLALACAAHALDLPLAEPPEPENVPGAPPPGVSILPGLTLSGYATVQFLSPDGRLPSNTNTTGVPQGGQPMDDSQYSRHARLDVSHLSGIAWWEPSPAWKVLAEVDLQDVVQLPAHSAADGASTAPYVALDRLYVDYRASDSVSVRAGKFLTPIGRWNQEHSDPQVWTVLRPLISQSAFPSSATGLMMFGSLPLGEQWIDYQAYAADGGEWRPNPHSNPFDRAFGGRLSTALNPDLQVGVSLSRFIPRNYAANEFDLVGVDGSFTWRRAEFSGEAIQRRAHDGNAGQEHGWFLQGVVPLIDRWWGVSRVEAYRRAGDSYDSRTALVGFVYRSGRHWVFKVEWAHATGSTEGLPSGLLSSVTLAY